MDAAIISAFAKGCERAINKALEYDPGTRAALAQMRDRVFALESTLPPITLYLIPSDDGVRILSYCEAPVDCRLRGSLPNLVALMMAEPQSLADSGVTVTGNTALLGQLQTVLSHLDIDWEEPLNALLGDELGHPLAQRLRGQWQWISSRSRKAPPWIGDYLSEELRVLPSQPELSDFYQAVDELRTDSDRLEARVQRFFDNLSNENSNRSP